MGRRSRPRVTGEARASLSDTLRREYDGGSSIRQLAARHSLSITLTRTLLATAGAQLRPRGGYQRRVGYWATHGSS